MYLVNTKESELFQHIFANIVKKYPEAIIYPFQVTWNCNAEVENQVPFVMDLGMELA